MSTCRHNVLLRDHSSWKSLKKVSYFDSKNVSSMTFLISARVSKMIKICILRSSQLDYCVICQSFWFRFNDLRHWKIRLKRMMISLQSESDDLTLHFLTVRTVGKNSLKMSQLCKFKMITIFTLKIEKNRMLVLYFWIFGAKIQIS